MARKIFLVLIQRYCYLLYFFAALSILSTHFFPYWAVLLFWLTVVLPTNMVYEDKKSKFVLKGCQICRIASFGIKRVEQMTDDV